MPGNTRHFCTLDRIVAVHGTLARRGEALHGRVDALTVTPVESLKR